MSMFRRSIPWPPTDLALLEEIYRHHYKEFESFGEGSRDSKVYVPIDCGALGRHFGVDPDIIFGRLYGSLERRFGVTNPNGSTTPFFALQVGNDVRAIHFPMMASVISDLRAERGRYRFGTWLAVIAIVLSIASFVFTALTGLA